MAYGARARQQSELLQLQQEVFDEVQGDTTHLAQAVFGNVDDQPDVGRVSNERLDQIYRQAYQRDDRPFLQREARRNPEQFLKATERIGVRIPPPMPQGLPVPGVGPSPPTGPAMPAMTALARGAGGLAAPVPSAGPVAPIPTPGAPVAAAPPVPGLLA